MNNQLFLEKIEQLRSCKISGGTLHEKNYVISGFIFAQILARLTRKVCIFITDVNIHGIKVSQQDFI